MKVGDLVNNFMNSQILMIDKLVKQNGGSHLSTAPMVYRALADRLGGDLVGTPELIVDGEDHLRSFTCMINELIHGVTVTYSRVNKCSVSVFAIDQRGNIRNTVVSHNSLLTELTFGHNFPTANTWLAEAAATVRAVNNADPYYADLARFNAETGFNIRVLSDDDHGLVVYETAAKPRRVTVFNDSVVVKSTGSATIAEALVARQAGMNELAGVNPLTFADVEATLGENNVVEYVDGDYMVVRCTTRFRLFFVMLNGRPVCLPALRRTEPVFTIGSTFHSSDLDEFINRHRQTASGRQQAVAALCD